MKESLLQTIYQDYLKALRKGNRQYALSVALQALEEGIDLCDLYVEVFQPAMHEIGQLWEANQLTVAQEHLATAITQSVMAQLYAHLPPSPPNHLTMVATCIGSELHELGIRMVADLFELEGWDVYYLGANVPTEDVVSMVNERRADLLAISVTLNTHVPYARELIQAVRASPIGSHIKIMVGGQPINRSPTISRAIGADTTASDAREAIKRAKELFGISTDHSNSHGNGRTTVAGDTLGHRSHS